MLGSLSPKLRARIRRVGSRKCYKCGTQFSSESVRFCDTCNHNVCLDCKCKECHFCKNICSEDCNKPCEVCSFRTCKKCSYLEPKLKRYICSNCYQMVIH